MWRRLRRKTMAPGRPTLYPDQVGLALLSLVAVAAGTYLVLHYLL